MSVRFVLNILGISVAAAALMLIGALGETEVLVYQQCGADGYLCEPPRDTAQAGHLRAEHRYGTR
jgi:hypothetical protein